jgi:dethiobiotin synthetase
MSERAAIACFVTGTDTGIGKTHASATLLHALRAAGHRAVGMKPVASGSEWRGDHWHNDDVAQLRAASAVAVPQALTCPFLLRTPASPHLAAAIEGARITREPIRAAFAALRAQADAVVVEGVGGFRVPLDGAPPEEGGWDTADLAVMLGLPVLLVVGIRLGCISHALLTAEAVRARGLHLAGWIANRIDPEMSRFEENLAALTERISAPLLGIVPADSTPEKAAKLIRFPDY